MKKTRSYQFVLALFNILPFLLLILFHKLGFVFLFCVFPFVQSVLNLVNFVFTQKVFEYVIFNFLMLLSNSVCAYFSAELWCKNISSDSMMITIGGLLVFAVIVYAVLLTITSLFVKLIEKSISWRKQ